MQGANRRRTAAAARATQAGPSNAGSDSEVSHACKQQGGSSFCYMSLRFEYVAFERRTQHEA
jgi:hypothetical protein